MPPGPEPLHGVIAPILTPFGKDLAIANDLYVELATRLLREGCVGLAPFGTTGEALSVASDERIAAIEALIGAGIDPSRLIPGTGLTNLPETAQLSRACLEMGVAGVMTLPPFYFKDVPYEGLYRYFAELVAAIDHPRTKIYLYHIPQVAGVGIPVPVVRRLRADFPDQIVGIKDSSGDWENTAALLGIEGLIVYPGNELPLLEALALGAPGCISATANLNAAAIAEVIRLVDAGNHDAAAVRQDKVRRFRLLMQGYAPIPAQKRLLALARDPRWAKLRPPLVEADEAEGRALADTITRDFGLELG